MTSFKKCWSSKSSNEKSEPFTKTFEITFSEVKQKVKSKHTWQIDTQPNRDNPFRLKSSRKLTCHRCNQNTLINESRKNQQLWTVNYLAEIRWAGNMVGSKITFIIILCVHLGWGQINWMPSFYYKQVLVNWLNVVMPIFVWVDWLTWMRFYLANLGSSDKTLAWNGHTCLFLLNSVSTPPLSSKPPGPICIYLIELPTTLRKVFGTNFE